MANRNLLAHQPAFDFSSRVFVKAIPSYWDKNEICSRFGIVGQIDDVYFVKNEQGKRINEVVISYKSE